MYVYIYIYIYIHTCSSVQTKSKSVILLLNSFHLWMNQPVNESLTEAPLGVDGLTEASDERIGHRQLQFTLDWVCMCAFI